MTTFSDLNLRKIKTELGLRRLACNAIKQAITEMDIYGHAGDLWLDERQLSETLGVSRTPVREALGYLEQEGLIRSIPRRGAYVLRKSKREIVEMITVWAAVESMAARLAAERASDEDLRSLRNFVGAFKEDPSSRLDEYAQANMAFHRAIIRIGGCALMTEMTDSMFIHMRAVRAVTMGQDNRARRSVADHTAIVEAMERRDAGLAERLVREHTLGLAAHVEKNGDALDVLARQPPPGRASPTRPRKARPAQEPAEDGAAMPGPAQGAQPSPAMPLLQSSSTKGRPP